MNKRLKEILKEYEKRKHKIIKGDESMNIVVLAGGTSTEREISIVTGTGVCKALRKKGHNAILVDIFCGLEPVDWDEPFGDKDYEVDSAAEYMRSFDDDIEEIKRTRRSFFGPNVLELCQAADIVFMGLHGSNGEDGKVQATFDLLGIRYTGTGYLSSALAMDKGLIFIRISTINGILIFFLVVYNINTYTGTTAACFYNNRKFHAKILDISCTVFFQHGNTLGCRYLVHKKDLLGEAFIHGKGTA